MIKPKVFISYSHDSTDHSDQVLRFAWTLRNFGIDADLDQFYTEEILDWPRWCRRQIKRENSDFVLCICTVEYQRRIEGAVSPEKGKGVYWEGSLLDDEVYDDKGNPRIIPILFENEPETSILDFLRGWSRCRINQFVLGDDGFEHLIRILTRQTSVEKNTLGTVPILPTKRAAADQSAVTGTEAKADISRILKYAPAELIGREDELKLLDEAWAKIDAQETPRTRVLTFVALGGEGKTALAAKWAAGLAAQDWPGCDAAFAWSFYSQGTREQMAASSDLFLKEALHFFALNDKDREYAASSAGAYEKGQRLARLIGQQRSLLILDGLEPLQYAPTPPTPGELKDQGLAALLKGLASASHGLCLVTTRYSLPDLRAFWQTTAPEVKLERLSRDAGVHLLKSLGVKGSALRNFPLKDGEIKSEQVNEFEKLVEDVKGHALTLTLLGTYLRDAHDGDIRKRDLVRLEEADAEEQAGHAFRVIEAYELAFEHEDERGKRALAILRLLGLFDRPMAGDCFAALLKESGIAGLTEPLGGITDAQLNIVLKRLEDARLLTANRDTTSFPIFGIRFPVSLDAHPHIREYFAKQLREKNPDAWRAAHRRLYEHLCATTKEGDHPTLEALQPLYQAVAHGCQAGLQQEAYQEVYFTRIKRGDEYYSFRKLGAFASDLGAIACFFDEPWRRANSTLAGEKQGVLLAQAAFYLRALGRLTEALEPMRESVVFADKKGDFANVARGAGSLSELELTLGEVVGAVVDTEQSVTYADRSGDAFQRTARRATHADALHQAGRWAEAKMCFHEAEQMQKELQPDYPQLYTVSGFQYCDLLLAAPERAAWRLTLNSGFGLRTSDLSEACRSVSLRAAKTLMWAQHPPPSLLPLALDHLTLGRAALYEAILERSAAVFSGPAATTPQPPHAASSSDSFFPTDVAVGGASSTPALRALQTARRELDAAVSGLRRAGQQQYLPLSLLTRAWLQFLTGNCTGPESTHADLDEAWEIAERGPMRLHMADIHLYRTRLFFREKHYPWESPIVDLTAARKLIEQCGYGRRKEELEYVEAMLIQQRP